jgi:hypothetical protein
VIAATVVLVCGGTEVASWPLTCGARLDLVTVDDLARLQVAARRLGCAVWVRDACPTLSGLLALCGLSEVLGAGREVRGEPEGGKQLGVEEVVVPDDPVA